MAYIGLRKPFVAKYNRSTGTYSDGFQYSHAVSLSVTPNYSEASLYGDDMQVEYEKAFTNASVSLGTTSTPIQAASVVFGHAIDQETNKVTYKATDSPNYVGIGVMAAEQVDGEPKFTAAIFPCVKFSDSADNFTTKGEQLQFNTPTIDGNAIANEQDEWKITRIYDSADDAVAFIKEYLSIADDPTDPDTP